MQTQAGTQKGDVGRAPHQQRWARLDRMGQANGLAGREGQMIDRDELDCECFLFLCVTMLMTT